MDHRIVRLVWLTFGQHLIGRKAIKSALTGVSLLAVAGLASACSDVPDAVNPVSWYHGVESWFDDDEEAPPPEVKTAAAAETAKTPGTEKSFPSVNEVPEKPAAASTVEERRQMMENLSADKANAQYLEENQTQAQSQSQDQGQSAAADSAAATPESAPAPASTATMPRTESTESGTPAGPAPAAGPPPLMPDAGSTAAEAPPPPPEKPILDLSSPPPPESAPPPPAAEAAAPPASGTGGEEVMAPSPGSAAIDKVYENKLQESAPTVSTAVAGPTQPVAGAPADGGSMENVPPQTMPPLATSESPVVSSEMQMAAAEMPPTFLGPSTHVSTIYFGNNSAAISGAEATKIREVADAYKKRGGRIRVFGYASSRTADMDPVQHQMVNFAVSVRRADAVARALVNEGVKAADIQTMALSDTQPVYYEFMPAGEAGNRRAEIFVDYYK